ncbi:MAG: STAS domain-containing protein [Myxococcales bacterium]|nr:STAS domain-containing protein [Myxococcota bacterium]MDW8281209.1 STAS domain-containing protein [Myxococcales bacterium]
MFDYRRELHGTVTILRLRGALDALSAPELKREIDALVAEKRSPVVLDLAGLELIDSSGVGAIVSLFKRLRQLSPPGEVKIAELRGQPSQIFQLLRLDRAFDICATVAEAIARLSK